MTPAVERRQSPRYRVTVHMPDNPERSDHFFNLFTGNSAALDYQRQMREIYRNAGLPVFVRKERL